MHADSEAVASAALGRDELAQLWRQLSSDPDGPEHFELSEHGETILSPSPTNRHQAIVAWVQEQLREQLGGRAFVELAVNTGDAAGVRKPDVSWLPAERWPETLSDLPLATCPPLVVEVLSPTNRRAAVEHKVSAYLRSGAVEVVVIDLKGRVHHHRRDGIHARSVMKLELSPPEEMFGK